MKHIVTFVVLVTVTACGSKNDFKGDGEVQASEEPYTSDVKPALPPEPVVQLPEPEPVETPTCPNPVAPVTLGSFTVWTEPACPQPFEIYEVVIKIVMAPEVAAKYNPRDLYGSIVGSDGFGKGFGPGSGTVTTFDAAPDGGIYRVALYAGADIVNDTVQINSSILLENQSVVINY